MHREITRDADVQNSYQDPFYSQHKKAGVSRHLNNSVEKNPSAAIADF